WKLYTRGSVGSQTLLGLPAIHALLNHPALARRSCWWPFDTGWDQNLTGIVHAEVWPSLANHRVAPYPIKDARQVAAARDWALALDAAGRLRPCFARPSGLAPAAAAACLGEEGWILNAPLGMARRDRGNRPRQGVVSLSRRTRRQACALEHRCSNSLWQIPRIEVSGEGDCSGRPAHSDNRNNPGCEPIAPDTDRSRQTQAADCN